MDTLKKFIDNYSLVEGRDGGHFYQCHGRTQITQPGALKIQRLEGILFDNIQLSTVAGRAVVSGRAFTQNEDGKTKQEYWTTGEANPAGKAVEGTHPVAMAEKRFRVRAILGIVLDADLTYEVYGDVEADWEAIARAESPNRTPAPTTPHKEKPTLDSVLKESGEGTPEWVAKLPAEWSNILGRIAECTHHMPSDFESQLLAHVSKNETGGNWYSSLSNGIIDFQTYLNTKTAKGYPLWNFGISIKDKAKKVAEQLRDGHEVILKWPLPYPESGWGEFKLSPRTPMDNRDGQPEGVSEVINDMEIPF